MTPPDVRVLGHFTLAAERCKSAETAYRKAAAAEIARLEQARVTAFRRARLIGLLEAASDGRSSAEVAAAEQRRRLCQELGWSGESPAKTAVLERLGPVLAALCTGASEPEAASRVEAELGRFEAWFLADRGVPFYSLFDTYVQETPVVDF
jgi:hypothetical protein